MTDRTFDPVTLSLVAVGLVAAVVITFRRFKSEGPPQYAPATTRQRVACGVVLAAMLAAGVIHFAGLDPFGGYTKLVIGAVMLASLLYVIRLLAILERA